VRRTWWLVLLAAALLGGCGHAAAKHSRSVAQAAGQRTYSSQVFGVALKCPHDWQVTSGYMARLQGKEGYLQLGALQGSAMSPLAAAQAQTRQGMAPFGSHPKLTALKLDGEPAYLILPSTDQSAQWQGESEVVVLYPKAQTIAATPYRYLILIADHGHIRSIAATLQFLH